MILVGGPDYLTKMLVGGILGVPLQGRCNPIRFENPADLMGKIVLLFPNGAEQGGNSLKDIADVAVEQEKLEGKLKAEKERLQNLSLNLKSVDVRDYLSMLIRLQELDKKFYASVEGKYSAEKIGRCLKNYKK